MHPKYIVRVQPSQKTPVVSDSITITSLYNTYKLQLLEDCSFRSRHEGRPLSFAMLDIDYFKRVNDSRNHPMDDWVIKSIVLFLE